MKKKINAKDIYRIYLIADWVSGLFISKEYRVLCKAYVIGEKRVAISLLSKINPDICFQVPNFIYEYKEFKKQYWKENYPLTKESFKKFIKKNPLPFDMIKRVKPVLKDILKFESKMTDGHKLLLEVEG